MRKNGKLFAALMCLLLLCALCLPALAEEVQNVKYIEYKWDGNTLTRAEKTCRAATKLTGGEETLSTGWYVAVGNISFSSRPEVSGHVHLILEDNCSLTANHGITVNEGTAEDGKANSLSIYAQSEGNNMGALTVSAQAYDAGIGGTKDNSGGLITIHGGTVTTTGYNGAGIGGGFNGSGTVTIHGGTVTTTGYNGAGIGGGYEGSGTVTIFGGTVTATAMEYSRGAGIGGGAYGTGKVTIYGGTVTATAMEYSRGAGIGGGAEGAGTVTIHGGMVTATASGYSAAIGNGVSSYGGSVTVTGGRVSSVHTSNSVLSIGGNGCEVSLSWKDADDYVNVAGFSSKDGKVTLNSSFLVYGSNPEEILKAGSYETGNLAGKLLLPNRSRTVRCIGYEWDEGEKRLKRKHHTVTNPRPLTGLDTVLTGGDSEDNAVWYRVSGPMTLSTRPEVSGHVHLILMDGCDLRAEKGITVNEGNFLSIFAQREVEGMGALTVPDQGNDAGIGGTEGNNSGLITIHGGKIDATGNSGAGIGGGNGGTGTIKIYGGMVTTMTRYPYNGSLSKGAGIGGGTNGNGEVKISGGTVTVTASGDGAGIGGGNRSDGTVTINGGTVMATASDYGAGIGGGTNGNGEVKISGGTVTVTASGDGAGIGGGYRFFGQGGSGEVTITGGTVTATASDDGAAIGNGNKGSGGGITVTGGNVSAVHTTQGNLSIGGSGCTVSLELTQKNDCVYAAGYMADGDKVTLKAPLQDASTGEEFLAGGVPVGDVARKLLIPNTPEAARQYAWSGAAFRLPGSLTGIGKGAFRNIRAATVLVPQGVNKIGADAFRGSGVKRIKFENGGTEVDPSAFADCPFVIAYAPEKSSVYDALKDVLNVYLMPVK